MDKLLITALAFFASVLPIQSYGALSIGYGSASFSDTTEASGCITTEVHVFVRTGNSAQTDLTAKIFLKITRFNVCTETALVQIRAESNISGTAFQVDATGQKATLDGMMAVSDDLHPGSYPLAIHMEWTAVSEPVAHQAKSLFVGPGIVSKLPQPIPILSTDAEASLRLTVPNLLNLTLDRSEAAALYQTQ